MTPPMPAGYRAATAADARAWVRGSVVEVWHVARAVRCAAVVASWNESGVLVQVADAEAPFLQRVALDVWDADLDPIEPRAQVASSDGVWVAVTRDVSASPTGESPLCVCGHARLEHLTVYGGGPATDCLHSDGELHPRACPCTEYRPATKESTEDRNG